ARGRQFPRPCRHPAASPDADAPAQPAALGEPRARSPAPNRWPLAADCRWTARGAARRRLYRCGCGLAPVAAPGPAPARAYSPRAGRPVHVPWLMRLCSALALPYSLCLTAFGAIGIHQMHGLARHDGRYGMLVDELGMPVAAQQYTKIIEPGHDPLQ